MLGRVGEGLGNDEVRGGLHRGRGPAAIGCAITAGVLSSAVPYLADLFTLRRVPAPAFGLFMSVNPVLAALVGRIGLGQRLGLPEWAGITAIVAANALSILRS